MTSGRQRRIALAGLAAAAATLAGCGSSAQYANLPRPPLQITLTSAIVGHRLSVSPNAIGAGPVMLVIANETPFSRQVTVSRPAPLALRVASGPINPGGTATLQINLRTGVYTVATDDPSIARTRIVVGARRPSAQNVIIQP